MHRSHCFAIAAVLSVVVAVGCTQSSHDSATNEPAMPDSSPPDSVTLVSFANGKCPIMGGKPSAELTTEYNGQTIGFCCDGCPEKWAALTDEEKSEMFAAVRVTSESPEEHAHHNQHDGHREHSETAEQAEHGDHESHNGHGESEGR